MLDLDAIEARAEAVKTAWAALMGPEAFPGEHFAHEDNVQAALEAHEADVEALVAELRAAREVVEAAVDLAERDGHKDDLCDDCGLGGHTSPCPWQSLDTSLAAYRAVVGTSR